jgi:hypothetical protein
MTAADSSRPPAAPPAPAAHPDPEAFAIVLRGQREAARRQQALRGEYLRELARDAEHRAARSRALVIGGIAVAVGLLITAVTYSHAASGGGIYVIAWGPVVFGLLQIVRGMTAR